MNTNNTHWLIPFDGSDHSIRALNLAIQEANARLTKPKLLLLNVQSPLPSDVTRFIDGSAIDDFHRENGEKTLHPAVKTLETSGLEYRVNILVGVIAQTIVDFGIEHACSMVIMGTHGLSGALGLVMGSVTTKVLHQSTLPLLLTK